MRTLRPEERHELEQQLAAAEKLSQLLTQQLQRPNPLDAPPPGAVRLFIPVYPSAKKGWDGADDFGEKLQQDFEQYLTRKGNAGRSSYNDARQAVVEACSAAFYAGYADETDEEPEAEDERWLTAKINEQIGFITEALASLKDMRDTDWSEEQLASRVEKWVGTMDGIYSEGKLRGAKNKYLVFDGDDGKESCDTCQDLKGRKMRVKDILDQELIPQPGNKKFDCGGWECQHYWKDPKTGERYTF